MTIWGVADAKNKFSELLSKAREEGPQRVERRGEVYVLLSAEEYDRLNRARPNFVEHLLGGPSFEGLDLERNQDPARDVNFGEDP